MKAKRPASPPEPGSVPPVAPKDHVFIETSAGPISARVLATGRHGITVSHGGEHRRVRWAGVLGHKTRAMPTLKVIDQGEDGAIMADGRGRRHFVRGYRPVPSAELEIPRDPGPAGEPFEKALPVLFFSQDDLLKAIKDRPGLSLQNVTDKSGRQTRRWKKTGQGPREAEVRGDCDAGAANGYGTHNLEPGESISFKMGDFKGRGKIVATGHDGATIEDSSGRQHKVPWAEVTGHEAAPGTKKPDTQPQVRATQQPISPDHFNAGLFAQSHDDPKVTAEAIVAGFPPDTAERIRVVQERLATIEQTISRFLVDPAAAPKDREYTAERMELHHKIMDEILSPQRQKAATPEEGEAPTFKILGGRGGSGKSWFEGKVYDPDKAIVLDADDIKSRLPEYEGWNAAQVHEESGDLFDRITALAKDLGLNIVHDATMKSEEKAVALVKGFKNEGYRVEAHYMHLPRQEAAKRAVARFLGKTQRYVPVEVVLSNTGNEKAFDRVRQLADKWSFRDNNVGKGEEPILISEGGQEQGGNEGALRKALKGAMLLFRRFRS